MNKELDQSRKDLRKSSSTILYEDNRYMIGACSQRENSHNLLVNNAYSYLNRGIFKELARSDVERLRTSLETTGGNILNEMSTRNIPLEELGWALAKAAIKEEENYSSYLFNNPPKNT